MSVQEQDYIDPLSLLSQTQELHDCLKLPDKFTLHELLMAVARFKDQPIKIWPAELPPFVSAISTCDAEGYYCWFDQVYTGSLRLAAILHEIAHIFRGDLNELSAVMRSSNITDPSAVLSRLLSQVKRPAPEINFKGSLARQTCYRSFEINHNPLVEKQAEFMGGFWQYRLIMAPDDLKQDEFIGLWTAPLKKLK